MKNFFLLILLFSLPGLILGQPLTGAEVLNVHQTEAIFVSELEATSMSTQKVKLTWTVHNNSSNLLFFVQRKTSSNSFVTIGGIRGTSSKSCTFFDKSPEKNKSVTYRIKIVEKQNSDYQKFSSEVQLTHKTKFSVPGNISPAQNVDMVRLPDYTGQQILVVGINISGKEILRQSIEVNDKGVLSIPLHNLSKGPHTFHMFVGGKRLTSKLILP